ncbi:MAG: ArnT family glycosyltransferase [Chlorobaculum sp.]
MIKHYAQASKNTPVFIAGLILIGFLYVVNFSINDIWTENESFYAEAVREMTVSKNYSDISYNYSPRFNKPPLTYWLIAASTRLFGLNEFAIRLPVVILAFWTVLLVWAMARMLYGEKTALLAFVMQAIGIQFIAGKQYASPEIPLAFFFTLTLYFFLKGQLSGRKIFYILTAISLGLTVLTKGYPYIIVIGGIIFLYLLIEAHFNLSVFWAKVKELNPFVFAIIVTAIGLSWVWWMYLRYGNQFLEVLNRETLYRAISQDSSNGLRDLFFYPQVILWSFFPYSLVFVYAFFHYVFIRRNITSIAFWFSWVIVMLVVFTAAKGKIPTYFIQAHPALALISARFIADYKPSAKASILWDSAFYLPSVISLILGTAIVIFFALPVYYYALLLLALLIIVLVPRPSAELKDDSSVKSVLQHLQPFVTTYVVLMVFSLGVLPRLEEYRQVDRIGYVINKEFRIPASIPIYKEGGLIHNLPYYAGRKVLLMTKADETLLTKSPLLVLIPSADVPENFRAYVIWSGYIYTKRSSESRLLIFIDSYLKAKRGDFSGFTSYSLIYKK